MKIIPETREDIVTLITKEFRSFGGGHVDKYNPISVAVQNEPPMFALGVDITDVVNRVIDLWESIKLVPNGLLKATYMEENHIFMTISISNT